MEVKLKPELAPKLSRLAAEQGRESEALVIEAIEKLIDYDEWLASQVREGISAADQNELIDHAELKKLIDRRYPG